LKIYVIDYSISQGAGHWIYKGYQNAWSHIGYDVVKVPCGARLGDEVKNLEEEFMIMTVDASIGMEDMRVLEKAKQVFVYAQPNQFPHPWGTHPNFICLAGDQVIHSLNQMENVCLWNWSDDTSFHLKWKKVNTVPLALDSISYKPVENKKTKEYDVCFIGGWANNGFGEKRKIMIQYFSEFMKTDLNCGFFVNKGITHDQENFIICNSKVCINIHDAHHLKNGFDTNERTFKTLGLNGCLISDSIGRGKETNQIARLFPDLPVADNPKSMIEKVREYIAKPREELTFIKEFNKENILKNHTYVKRVERFIYGS
jgi:hypothetical protein